MKFLHKFQTFADFQNSVYFPESERGTVAAIIVGGTTYYYSHLDGYYYIWVNPNNQEDWVDSDVKRNPEAGDSAYILGNTSTTIDSVIYYDSGESEGETETYQQPWVSWIVNNENTDVPSVMYNKYNFNGYDYVDLGLPSGLMWATSNVGASSPEEYGSFYAWGEVETKSSYTWDNYIWGTQNNSIKYNNIDDIPFLAPGDDVAYVMMGGGWHMPTYSDIMELLENTTQSSVTINGVPGRLFTSNINSNSIFFPLSGHKYDGRWSEKDVTFCVWSSDWISTKYGNNCNTATILYWNPDDNGANYNSRYWGCVVRGVVGKSNYFFIEPQQPPV